MSSPLPCPTCTGLGRLYRCTGDALGEQHSPGDLETAPCHVYWCTRCHTELDHEDGEPTSSDCPGCSVACGSCDGRGAAGCVDCGAAAVALHPDYSEPEDGICAACMDRLSGVADAHAERCSQWGEWVAAMESASGMQSRRARRVAA